MEAQYKNSIFFPKYSFQQIEPTDKSSYVLYIQWHFFQKSALGYSTLLLALILANLRLSGKTSISRDLEKIDAKGKAIRDEASLRKRDGITTA